MHVERDGSASQRIKHIDHVSQVSSSSGFISMSVKTYSITNKSPSKSKVVEPEVSVFLEM